MDDLPMGRWSGFDAPMTSNETPITRRCAPHRSDCWLIYFGDVHVGSVGRAVGTGAAQRWVWFCGFYPGSNPASNPWHRRHLPAPWIIVITGVDALSPR